MTETGDETLIRYDVRDRVAEITMVREPVNAINFAFTRALNEAYLRARHGRPPGTSNTHLPPDAGLRR